MFWRRRHRKQPWGELRSYAELHRALRVSWPVGPDEFLEGPLPRFLELATASTFRGDQIRAVEHARHWVQRICDAQREGSGQAAAFEAAAQAMARRAFAAHPWLMEAFNGQRGHHG